MKRTIRLRESELRRMIAESVRKVLNEVEFGGETLHGNNPEDWAAMKHLRSLRMDKDADDSINGDITDDEQEARFKRNLRNWERNGQNEIDLLDKMYPDDYSKYFERGRGLDAKGYNKAGRIGKNLGY